MSTNPQVWIAAIVTLAIYSYLFYPNLFQRSVEHIMVGLGLAHSIIMGFNNVKSMAWIPLANGAWYMAVPLLLGFLMWSRWFKRYSYLSRPSIGLMVGAGAAVALRGALSADLMGQLLATIRLPLNVPSNWVVIIGVFGTLIHFMFVLTSSRTPTEKPNALAAILRPIGETVGQGTIMVALGAAYAYTIMGRVSIVIGRFQFLFRDWMPLIPK
jgi:hypothetical protein